MNILYGTYFIQKSRQGGGELLLLCNCV